MISSIITAVLATTVTSGLHISTSTTYDYARHQGMVSVETFVEGRTTIIRQGTPLDIVLVLDVSGSMENAMKGEKFVKYDDFDKSMPAGTYYTKETWFGIVTGGYVTKLGRMMDAAFSFVESIEANARALGLDHRVGIVTFSSQGKTKTAMELTSVNGRLDDFKSTIYSFKADGATASDEGLRQAAEVFGRSGRSGESSRAVLMFTDRAPTHMLLFDAGVANDAIVAAGSLKNALDCSIYSVGMFDEDVNWWVDNYMNGVSSNYPAASSLTELGSGSDKGYYFNVTDASGLSAVFDGISEDIIVAGADVQLSEQAEIRDYMPPYMQLPAGTSVEDIHIYTCRCVGYDEATGEFSFSTVREAIDLGPDGITISADEDGCALVSVTGFDYRQHWCGPGMTSGRKLIVHIPFVLSAVNDGEFNPNRHESGIYDPEGNAAGSFDVHILKFYDLTVECSGLCSGESAVYRLMDTASGKFLCRFAISSENGGHKVIKNVPEGAYTLIEEGWNWAYTTLPAKNVDFILSGNTTLRFDVTHASGPDIPLHTEIHRTN